MINSEIIREGPTTIEGKHPAKQRRRVAAAPSLLAKSRETRKTAQDNLIASAAATASSNLGTTTPTSAVQNPNLLINVELLRRKSCSSSSTRDGVTSSLSRHVQESAAAIAQSTINMQGIDPGVEFLPGSTLFVEYKGSLCLAKMLKKRGKFGHMEYLLQFKTEKKKKIGMAVEGKEEPQSWVATTM